MVHSLCVLRELRGESLRHRRGSCHPIGRTFAGSGSLQPEADTSHLRVTLPAMPSHPFTVPVVVTGDPTDVTIVAGDPRPVTVMVSSYPHPAGSTTLGSVVIAVLTSRVFRISAVVGGIFRENHTQRTPGGAGQISISSISGSRFASSGSKIVRSRQYSESTTVPDFALSNNLPHFRGGPQSAGDSRLLLLIVPLRRFDLRLERFAPLAPKS